MRLLLQRQPSHNGWTLGDLYVDNVWFCYTCEDEIREIPLMPVAQWKIKGQTAIPEGLYGVIIDYSSRFKRLMPHVLGVDGFDGIRIHPGNTSADTEGCVLVGYKPSAVGVYESRAAFDVLMNRLRDAAARMETVTLEIRNPREPQTTV